MQPLFLFPDTGLLRREQISQCPDGRDGAIETGAQYPDDLGFSRFDGAIMSCRCDCGANGLRPNPESSFGQRVQCPVQGIGRNRRLRQEVDSVLEKRKTLDSGINNGRPFL